MVRPRIVVSEAHTTRLTRALELCQGDLLAEEPYEEYATEPREHERTAMLEGSAALAEALLGSAPAEADRILR